MRKLIGVNTITTAFALANFIFFAVEYHWYSLAGGLFCGAVAVRGWRLIARIRREDACWRRDLRRAAEREYSNKYPEGER